MEDVLHAHKLQKTYVDAEAKRAVLKDVSLSLRSGEFVALVGRSGSGKSTLLNCLAGIDSPSQGDILINDWNMARASDSDRTRFRRAHIGFVFQSFHLIPTLTILENIRLPLDLNGISPSIADQRATEYLELIGLGGRGQSFPDRLSGGEQQRVALARALVNHPLLVLADEPTGNLDHETGIACLRLLDALRRKSGSAVLMVTHSFEAAKTADRILRMEEGRIRAEPAPGDAPSLP